MTNKKLDKIQKPVMINTDFWIIGKQAKILIANDKHL